MRGLRRRLVYVAVAISATLTIGTIGFVVIEGYPAFDAFYMSLITITTVGYREIQPLSRAGRIFNTFLLVFGVGTMFYAFGVMTQTIIELQLGEIFFKRRIKRMIDKLKDHYIVCGFGRVGRGAAEELQRAGVSFVVVDTDPARIESAIKKGMLGVIADAKTDATLNELSIGRARGLVGALGSDADNLFLVLSAKTLNPKLKVSSRVNEEESESKLRMAGADAIFRPYSITGFRLAQAILRPHVFRFLEFATPTVDMGRNIELEQIRVNEDSEFSSKSLKELQIRRDLGVIVLAIHRADGSMEFNPPADAVIQGGDYLIVMGDLKHLEKLASLMKGKVQS